MNGTAGGNPISEQHDSYQPDGSGGAVSADFLPRAQHLGRRALNNYAIPAYSNFQHTTIPSIKIDQVLNSQDEVVRLLLVDGNKLAQ